MRNIPKAIREKVKSKFNGRCGYCGVEHSKLQIDHIIPVSHHHRHKGLNINCEENLMPACFSCNNYKLNRSVEEFRHDLSEQVRRARQYSLNFRLAERFGQIKETNGPIVFYFEQETE